MGLREKNIRLMKEIRFYRNCKERNSRYGLEMRHTHKKCCGQCHKCDISTEEESKFIFAHVVFKTITEYLGKKEGETQVRIQEMIKDESKPISLVNSL